MLEFTASSNSDTCINKTPVSVTNKGKGNGEGNRRSYITRPNKKGSIINLTQLVLFDLLVLKVIERVGATRIGPHIGESDLFGCALLEEKFAVRGAEDEGAKGTVEETFVDVLHQVAWGAGMIGLVLVM